MAMDYYEVLGVSKTASGDEIKAAYKQLALTKHPDKDHSNPNATAEFQKIVEAYVVLKDETKRKAYDNGKLNEMFSDDEDDDYDDYHYDPGFSGGGGGGYWCENCGTYHASSGGGGGGGGGRSRNSFASFFNAYFASQFGYGNSFFADDFDRYYYSRREERRAFRGGGGSSRRPPPSTKTPPPPLKKPDVVVDEATAVVTISWPEVEFNSSRQDMVLMFTVTGKTKPRRIWRGVGTKVSISGLDPGTYGAIIQLSSKQGIVEGRLSIENQFKIPRIATWKASDKIQITSDQSGEEQADQPFPNQSLRSRKPHQNEPPKSNPSTTAPTQQEQPNSSSAPAAEKKAAPTKPVKVDSPAQKLSKQLDAAISKRSIEQIEQLLTEIKSTPEAEAAISAGQIRSAQRILRINAAIKSVSDIAGRVENSVDISELEKAENEILELVEGLDASLFEYNLKSIRDRKEAIVSLQNEEKLIKDAVLRGELSDVSAWLRSLSKAQKREPLRLRLLSQAQNLRSISEIIEKLKEGEEDDSFGTTQLDAMERDAQAAWQQYSASASAELSRKVRVMIEEAIRDKRDQLHERTLVHLAVAPPTTENLNLLQLKFSELTLKSQLRVRSKLEDSFRARIETIVNRNSPDDYARLKHVLEVGSTLLDFESSDIGDIFAQAWANIDRYEQFFAAVKDATAAGINLTDQQRGLLLADPVAQLEKIKLEHQKRLEAQRLEEEKRAKEKLLEAQRQQEAERKRLEEEQRKRIEKLRLEQQQREAQKAEAQRLEQQRRAEALRQQELAESRRLEEQQRAETQRIEHMKRVQAQRAEQQRKQAEARRLEQKSRAEEAERVSLQQAAAARLAEQAETQRIEQMQRDEAKRLAKKQRLKQKKMERKALLQAERFAGGETEQPHFADSAGPAPQPPAPSAKKVPPPRPKVFKPVKQQVVAEDRFAPVHEWTDDSLEEPVVDAPRPPRNLKYKPKAPSPNAVASQSTEPGTQVPQSAPKQHAGPPRKQKAYKPAAAAPPTAVPADQQPLRDFNNSGWG
eukprot:TRINITY_DN4025_c0_g3_i1.p1 TRINITY_DN4025_c0_g3~~TRINITY_DN4025_c0_g3_i1.p1  ORF type:complete len:1032 (-),score=315.18 TRINITY_DN4025_c0_g3_i1:525-3620(-)